VTAAPETVRLCGASDGEIEAEAKRAGLALRIDELRRVAELLGRDRKSVV
jgi:hypothetical protein